MMGLLRLVRREMPRILKPVTAVVFIAGVANCALVVLINAGAAAVTSQQSSAREFALFSVALAIFWYATVAAGTTGRTVMETAMGGLRLRLFATMRRADLRAVESLDSHEVIAHISRDVGQVLRSTDSLVTSFQSLVMLVACCVYMTTISTFALALVLSGIGALAYVRYVRTKLTRDNLRRLIASEGRHSRLVGDLIGGFKEVKISAARERALFSAYARTVEDAKELGIQTGQDYVKSSTYIQVGAFMVLAIVVFVMPVFVASFTEAIMVLTVLIIFMIVSTMGIVSNIPELAQADAALEHLYELEAYLDRAAEDLPEDAGLEARSLAGFDRISLRGVRFSYRNHEGQPTFSMGPVDASFARGRTHFVAGGNGSGKSTFLKLLTGLYPPEAGVVEVGGAEVGSKNLVAYRNLFGGVFAEAHLFERLYGLDGDAQARAPELITAMGLEGKVSFADGRFSTVDLSTGQRKRLALIGALLEDRDVLVFDEWAADQDQHFRRIFYEEILGDLRRRGKTIFAITHDERFWGLADRLFLFENGEMVELDPARYAAPSAARAT